VTDHFAAVSRLPGVSEVAGDARRAVDELLWDRSLRERFAAAGPIVAAAEARASAALDGADLPLELVLSGAAEDGTPIGQVVAAAIRVTEEAQSSATLIDRAPLQLLARLALLAGRDFVSVESLGQPRTDVHPDDPLRLGPAPAVEEVRPRLAALSKLLAADTKAPALVVAALVHGELLALRPFAFGSGLSSRAAGRAVLAARGIDPAGLLAPSAGLAFLGRPGYVSAARGYIAGTADGVAGWVAHCCLAVERAVAETRELLN